MLCVYHCYRYDRDYIVFFVVDMGDHRSLSSIFLINMFLLICTCTGNFRITRPIIHVNMEPQNSSLEGKVLWVGVYFGT